MFKKIFNTKKKEVPDNKNILIASLLIHAARIDENYTDVEKKIIKKALMEINTINSDEAENLIKLAEKKAKRLAKEGPKKEEPTSKPLDPNKPISLDFLTNPNKE